MAARFTTAGPDRGAHSINSGFAEGHAVMTIPTYRQDSWRVIGMNSLEDL